MQDSPCTLKARRVRIVSSREGESMATDETEKGELRSFALVLQSLDEGTVHGDCTDRLQELNTQLMKYAEDFGKAKGTLKLTLKMTVERGGTAEDGGAN